MLGLECLILGDSIAVGTIQSKPGCIEMAKGGINSWQWNKMYYDRPVLDEGKFKIVVISLGSNDHEGVHTKQELEKMRGKVKADKVFWIMPAIKQNIQSIVEEIAHHNGDSIIPITRLQKDGIHPSAAGYKEIVNQIK